jgi:CubicO group peptidase (beta-lactamase class C family)
LLTHTSGLMHSWDLPDFARHSSMPATPAETIDRFKNQPLVSAPGEKYHYSGLGYFILAAVIENVTGQSYEGFLQKHILDPLGMEDTGGEHPETLLPGRASGYRWKDGHLENAPQVYLPVMTGAGNLYSTAEDLNRFDQAVHSRVLVSQKTLDAMFTPALKGAAYGAGWELLSAGGRRVIGHTGSVNGFMSACFRFVDSQLTTIALSNIAYTPSPSVAAGLAELALQ